MARKKEYNEQEVIEKAMYLFWKKGYEATSIRMLEKEMGINQFSIYSSFGNKQGVFVESMKLYKKKIKTLTDQLKYSNKGVQAIKQFFIDFIKFSQDNEIKMGCFITNAVNEIGKDADPLVWNEVVNFTDELKNLFIIKLKNERNESSKIIEEKANYLLIAMQGFSMATKVFETKELDDYLDNTFKNL